jgi:hypothetical protein
MLLRGGQQIDETEYRQQLETRAVRAANVETRPTSSGRGKPNGATALAAAGNGKESNTP